MKSPAVDQPSDAWKRPRDAELVLGIVAGVGTPLELVQTVLQEQLRGLKYDSTVIHLSRLTDRLQLEAPVPAVGIPEAERIELMMNRGNEARIATGRTDILAMLAVGDIRVRRNGDTSAGEPTALRGEAFILRQLKHPDEVLLLRQIYGDGFHLLGIYCRRRIRESKLRERGLSTEEVAGLIDRDEHEPSDEGQHLRDTFHLADVFLEIEDTDAEDRFSEQVNRFFELLFGLRVQGPTIHEFGMFQAYTNALRSTQLGRQVGASIMRKDGDLVAVGANEVPRPGGGVYWEGDEDDGRDHKMERDSSDAMREEIALEIASRLTEGWSELSDDNRGRVVAELMGKIKGTTIWGLTEFGRAVHAEAEAIVSAARAGVSPCGCLLYCTTFPCHVCAKHIVSAGIVEVHYIEPYPKSRAHFLFYDSINLEEERGDRVVFKPFVGIAPRRFVEFFSMSTREGELVRRKDETGRPIEGERCLRMQIGYMSALDREKIIAQELERLTQQGGS